MIKVPPSGPTSAKIAIVGEAPGEEEVQRLTPFVGASGRLLDQLLHNAGILRTTCFVTNVVPYRPSGNDITKFIPTKKKDITSSHAFIQGKYVTQEVVEGLHLLHEQLSLVQPELIIALGNTPLWALANRDGIFKWRGSQLTIDGNGTKLMPTLHPAYVLRDYASRNIVTFDLKRAKRSLGSPWPIPDWQWLIRPSFQQALDFLQELLDSPQQEIAVDIETRGHRHTSCIGIATSPVRAICIPLMCVERPEGYWTVEEELKLLSLVREVTRKHKVVGQNFTYDQQYFAAELGIRVPMYGDTMHSQHTLFPGTPKSLDYLASLHCSQYVYWKDDGKEWDMNTGEDKQWGYNCEDACRTLEIWQSQQPALAAAGLSSQNEFRLRRLNPAVLRMMLRGMRWDKEGAERELSVIRKVIGEKVQTVEHWLGHPFNPKSPTQMQKLFYTDFGEKIIWNTKDRKNPRPTLDDAALMKIAERTPVLRRLCHAILDIRSMGVFASTFLEARLSSDGRMRCSFNISGPYTFRFSSSEDAFGSGLNFQNIPSEETKSYAKALKRGSADDYPDIRKLVLPDPGKIIWNIDLDRADLQVVVWEADDLELKQMLREGVDLHKENAKVLFQVNSIADVTRGMREFAKSFVHGCLTAGHEILTPRGWVPMESYVDGTPIMVWSESSSFFETPRSFNRDLAVDFVSFEGESQSIEMTWDHRVPYNDGGKLFVKRAFEVPSSARVPVTGNYSGKIEVPETAMRLLAALQADGSIDVSGNVQFHFRRERKILRMRELLSSYRHRESVYKDGSTVFYVYKPDFAALGKHPREKLLLFSAASLDAYLDELKHWDGHTRESVVCHLAGTDKEDLQWMQTVAQLRGFGSRFNLQRQAEGNRKDLYRLSLNNRQFSRLSSHAVRRYTTEPRPVFCPQTSTGFFFVRRNGRVMVTGNTNYGGHAPTMAKATGTTVHQADLAQRRWFAAHPGIKEWHARVENELMTKRQITNRFGYRVVFFDEPSNLLPEALAWIPQSTVACVTNFALVNIHEQLPADECEPLNQVHDSNVGQCNPDFDLRRLLSCSLIPIPYPDPLTIPVSIKTSAKSWGDCENVSFK